MKKIWLLVTALLLISLLGASVLACGGTSTTTSTTQAAPKTTVLRLAVPWPPGDPVTNNIEGQCNILCVKSWRG